MTKAQKTKDLIRDKKFTEAFNLNTGLAYKISSTFIYKGRLRGMTFDDLYQEALMNLWIAVHDYSIDNGAYFSTFACTVMRNKLLNLFKTERPILEGDEDMPIKGSVSCASIIDKVLVSEVISKFTLLSKMERDCVIALCVEVNNCQVSDLHDCSPQNISVCKKRAVSKLQAVV